MAYRTGTGFVDVVSSVQDRSKVLATGEATKADRRFQGQSISQLAKLAGGSVDLATDLYGQEIVTDLQTARSEAFKEFQRFTKQGTAAVRQGKTPKALYNTMLVKKVQEIEKRYPGFAEEVEDAKKAMGIKPRDAIIAEEQRMRVLEDQALLDEARTLKTLRFNSDRSIDWDETFNDTSELKASNAARATLETRAKARGETDVTEHGPAYLSGSDTIYKNLAIKFSNETRSFITEIDKIVTQGGNPKELITQGLTKLTRWEQVQLNQIRDKWYGKDREKFTKFITDKVAGIRQIITGKKEPQGMAASLEMYTKMVKNMDLASLRESLPALSRLINIGGEAAQKAILSDGLLKLLSSGKIKNMSTGLNAWLLAKDATSLVSTPSFKGDPKEIAEVGLNSLHSILKNGPFTEENAQIVFGANSMIARAHNNGHLEAEDYEAIRKTFDNPVFKGFLEKQPKRKQQELGSLAFDVFNSASEKHLAQITSRGFFRGIEYTGDKLKIIADDAAISVAEQRGAMGIRSQIEQDEKVLNKLFDDMNFYLKFKKAYAESPMNKGDIERHIRSLNGEAIALRFSLPDITELPVIIGESPTVVRTGPIFPANFNFRDAFLKGMELLDRWDDKGKTSTNLMGPEGVVYKQILSGALSPDLKHFRAREWTAEGEKIRENLNLTEHTPGGPSKTVPLDVAYAKSLPRIAYAPPVSNVSSSKVTSPINVDSTIGPTFLAKSLKGATKDELTKLANESQNPEILQLVEAERKRRGL